jgi:hypothetical protein
MVTNVSEKPGGSLFRAEVKKAAAGFSEMMVTTRLQDIIPCDIII